MGPIGLFWGWGWGPKTFFGFMYIDYQLLFFKYRSSLVLSCSFEFVVGGGGWVVMVVVVVFEITVSNQTF